LDFNIEPMALTKYERTLKETIIIDTLGILYMPPE